MPLYDYDCLACGRRIEVVHGVHAPGPSHCPNCGLGPLRKAISAPAVHFKGSGWAKKERRATAASGASRAADEPGGASDGGGDGGAAGTDTARDAETDKKSTDSSTSPTTRGGGTATKTD